MFNYKNDKLFEKYNPVNTKVLNEASAHYSSGHTINQVLDMVKTTFIHRYGGDGKKFPQTLGTIVDTLKYTNSMHQFLKKSDQNASKTEAVIKGIYLTDGGGFLGGLVETALKDFRDIKKLPSITTQSYDPLITLRALIALGKELLSIFTQELYKSKLEPGEPENIEGFSNSKVYGIGYQIGVMHKLGELLEAIGDTEEAKKLLAAPANTSTAQAPAPTNNTSPTNNTPPTK